MNIASISVRNLNVRKLSSLLTTISVAMGAALVASLWLMIDQTDQRYKSSLKGYDAIIGPKEGSPLALVLSTVMNLGYQPGVVPMSVYNELRTGRLAGRFGTDYAVPQARGDYYGGFPIIGTTDEWFTKFARGRSEDGKTPVLLEMAEGRHWSFGHGDFVAFAESKAAALQAQLDAEAAAIAAGDDPDHDHAHDDGSDHDHSHDDGHAHGPALPVAWRQAVIGSQVARDLGLDVGSKIVPVHGEEAEVAHHHDEAESEIVGILAATGTPIDRSIYVPMGLFLSMDKHDAIRQDTQEIDADNVLISAIVYSAKHPLAAAWLRREFQTREDAQVAWPQIEISQLLQMVGNAADILRIIAWLVVAVASIGVCVALYNTMNERRREIAIMRALGADRFQILTIIVTEALMVSLVGAVLGVVICHGAAWVFADTIAARTSVAVEWTAFSVLELWLILGITALGGLAGMVPALKGSSVEVADNLGPVS